MGTSMFRITERMLKVQEFAIWLRLCLSPPPREQLAFWLFHRGGGAALPGAGAVCGGCHGGAAALRRHRACQTAGLLGHWACRDVAMLARGYAGMWLSSLHHARLLLVGPPAPSQAAFPRGSENLFSSAQFGLSAVLFFFLSLRVCMCRTFSSSGSAASQECAGTTSESTAPSARWKWTKVQPSRGPNPRCTVLLCCHPRKAVLPWTPPLHHGGAGPQRLKLCYGL